MPLGRLLSEPHVATWRALIGDKASLEQRPSILRGYEHLCDGVIERAQCLTSKDLGDDAGEPTMVHLSERCEDTVHLDAIGRWENVISVIPSGGWLQSSPVIPELGFALNSRAQMFWLEDGLNQSLAPGARPRTTPSPSLAWDNNGRLWLLVHRMKISRISGNWRYSSGTCTASIICRPVLTCLYFIHSISILRSTRVWSIQDI